MSTFLGMKGTGDWATNERPESWRQGILYEYPNGSAPLTAILSMMKSQKVDDPVRHWWTKTLPTQRATVTGVYTDSGLSTAYTSGGSEGDIVYVKMSSSDISHFRVGHQVLLRDASDYAVDCTGLVKDRVENGSSSYIAVKLLEDDDNSSSHDLSDCDTALIIGNANPEGAYMPDALAYDPTEYMNYAQIFMSPLDLTRTAIRTRLRTEDSRKEAKRECLELFSIEMEKAFIWSYLSSTTGENGKPLRTMYGLIPFIKAYASSNVDDYTLNTDYSGSTWLSGGETWLDEMLEVLFRYGSDEKLALVGSGALMGINRLAKNSGTINLTPKTEAYGLKVVEWVTPFGVLYMKRHPLFSYEPTNRYAMLVLEPKDLIYTYVDDVFYKSDKDGYKKGGNSSYDGIKEGYVAEATMEIHFPNHHGYLNGIGKDNELA